MCGFTSILSSKGLIKYHQEYLIKMNKKILHRGPDSNGYWLSKNGKVLFGHNRLSIVDLSANGHQPMESKNKNLTIVFNGEIYNHLEIRQKYLKNFKFNSHCDTETLLECISILGIQKTLKLLDGMFSFVVYDKTQDKIYLARDRMGEKPLYYTKINNVNDNFYLISSELKSFNEHPAFKKNLDYSSINNYMQYKYIPTPNTIFENTFKLNPGCYAEISLKDMYFKKCEYWNIQNEVFEYKKVNINKDNIYFKNKLKKILKSTIKNQLLGDVDIGSFLSGGIDSSLITAIMSEISQKKINTFSVGFDNKEFDESLKANQIAKILNTNHHELKLNSKDILNNIPNIVDIYDEPFSDSSQIPTFLISKFASSKLKVCLSGDGGDELFGGYNRYIFIQNYWKVLNLMPSNLRKLICKIIPKIKPKYYDVFFNLFLKNKYDFYGDKIHKIANILKFDSFENLNDLIINDKTNYKLLNNEIDSNLDLNLEYSNKINNSEKLMINDMRYYLPDDILVKVDRAAMSNSLETRMPFLSKEVINIAWTIPFNLKIKNKISKKILKNILSDYLPQELIENKKKGFAIPLADWLRNDLRDWSEQNLSKQNIENFNVFNYNEVNKLWNDHVNLKKNNHSLLWSVIVMQNWLMKNYI